MFPSARCSAEESIRLSSVRWLSEAGGIRTFNVRFPEKSFDETWAAEAGEAYRQSHTTLSMDTDQGPGTDQCASPPSRSLCGCLVLANAVCRLMRKSVTVALSEMEVMKHSAATTSIGDLRESRDGRHSPRRSGAEAPSLCPHSAATAGGSENASKAWLRRMTHRSFKVCIVG